MSEKDLAHLAPEQVEELVERYYSGEEISTLIAEFEVDCSPNSLWRLFPSALKDSACSVCGGPLVQPRASRSRERRYGKASPRCENCGHFEEGGCRCPACEASRARHREAAAQRKRVAIEEFCAEHWMYERIEPQAIDLPHKVAVALVALVRSGGWKNEETVGPWGASGVPFAPNALDYRRHLVGLLVASGLVAPAPRSPVEAFPMLDNGKRGWKPELVEWRILHPDPSRLVREIEGLARSEEWPEQWDDGAKEAWLSLAAAECWEFCAHCMETRSLPMPGHVALTELIDGLLRDYSVSQCVRIIWSGTTKATDAQARRHMNRQHAANYMIGAAQRLSDHARVKGWSLDGFARNYAVPRSQMSYVLHDVFLGHGDTGFFQCPGRPQSRGS